MLTPLEIVKAATQAINEGRIEEALTYYAEEVVQQSPATAEQPGFKLRYGKAALEQVLQADRSQGVRFHHQHYTAENNVVAVEGTNSGLLNGVYVEQPVAVFYEVREQRITQVTVYYDRLALSKVAPRVPFWDVLLIGGASGTGKTRIASHLARHYAVSVTQVDDLHQVVERMTTPEQQPVLHYWRTHPEAGNWPPEQIMELHLSVGRLLTPALEAVILSHLEDRTPLILEGDYLLPEVAASQAYADLSDARSVQAIFLYEPDEPQLIRNFAEREPGGGEQTKRARVSWLYGQWLKEECSRLGLMALPSQPWDSLPDRINKAVA